MFRAPLLLCLLPLLAACNRDERTPEAFAKDWAAVVGTEDEEQQAALAAEVRKKWQSSSYEWEGLAMAGLCVEARRQCALDVFRGGATPATRLLGGMLPLVTFSEAEYGKLKAGCHGLETCVVRFKGDLEEVRLDPELPLGMGFSNARVVTTRALRDGDKWFADLPMAQTATAVPRTQPPEDAAHPPAIGKRTF